MWKVIQHKISYFCKILLFSFRFPWKIYKVLSFILTMLLALHNFHWICADEFWLYVLFLRWYSIRFDITPSTTILVFFSLFTTRPCYFLLHKLWKVVLLIWDSKCPIRNGYFCTWAIPLVDGRLIADIIPYIQRWLSLAIIQGLQFHYFIIFLI